MSRIMGELEGCSTAGAQVSALAVQAIVFDTHGDWLTDAFGVAQGFDHFDLSGDAAGEVLTRARSGPAHRDPQRPNLLLVHLFDRHSDEGPQPYEAPPSTAGRCTRSVAAGARDWSAEKLRGSLFLRGVHRQLIDLAPEAWRSVSADHDEQALGRLGAIGYTR